MNHESLLAMDLVTNAMVREQENWQRQGLLVPNTAVIVEAMKEIAVDCINGDPSFKVEILYASREDAANKRHIHYALGITQTVGEEQIRCIFNPVHDGRLPVYNGIASQADKHLRSMKPLKIERRRVAPVK